MGGGPGTVPDPACVKAGNSQSSPQDLVSEVTIMGQRSEDYCMEDGGTVSLTNKHEIQKSPELAPHLL